MGDRLLLNNLVDLLLVVGADKSSNLQRPISSIQHQICLAQRQAFVQDERNNGARKSPKTPQRQAYRNGSLGDPEIYDLHDHSDLLFQLIDPSNEFTAHVLQIFSANSVNYPQRLDNEQLVSYPFHVQTGEKACLARSVSSGTDSISPPTSLSYVSSDRVSAPVRERAGTICASNNSTLSQRRHTINSFTIPRCAGSARKSIWQACRPNSDHKISSNSSVLLGSKSQEMPLSFEQINALCQLSFPDGFRCYETCRDPCLNTYVLTDIDGERFYAVTLTFYRKVSVKVDPDSTSDKPSYHIADEEINPNDSAVNVYIPVCIILVSKYPYYKTLQKCLTQLYTNVASNEFYQFDDIISKFALTVTNAPVPLPGSDMSLSLRIYKEHQRIIIHPSSHVSQPVVDLDVYLITDLLKPEVLCSIIAAVLQEQRIVFMCSNYSLLTQAQETILALIYPFRWQTMYVPVLTVSMIGLVEAPGYFIMGCHSDFHSIIKDIEGIMIVDLDKGSAKFTPTSKEQEIALATHLPISAASSFCTKIVDLKTNFELASIGKVHTDPLQAREDFQNKLIKDFLDIALNLMVDLFKNVDDHMIQESCTTNVFNMPAFLQQHHSDDQLFYSNVTQTSMFKAFLRDRLNNVSLDIFDFAVSSSGTGSNRKSLSVISKEKKRRSTVTTPPICIQIFNLPYMDNIQQFQDDTLLNLQALLEIPGGRTFSKTSILYLMGLVYINQGNTAAGINCFGDLHNIDSSLMPKGSIYKVLANSESSDQILKSVSSRHAKLCQDLLLSYKSHTASSAEVKVELEDLPLSSVDESQFLKYSERLDLAVDKDTSKRLFFALAQVGRSGDKVDPGILREFYETWKYNEARCRELEGVLSNKCARGFVNHVVIKTSELENTDLGTGYVILTDRSLLLLEFGSGTDNVKEIAKLSEIKELQIATVRSITLSSECLKVFKSGLSKPYNLHLKQHCYLWKVLLEEMIGGKVISTATKDIFLMQQASRIAQLLDALITSFGSAQNGRGLEVAVNALAYFSKVEIKERLLGNHGDSKDILLYRLNPNADEMESNSVECVLYVPGGSNQRNDNHVFSPCVWCGMSNGKVKVFNASTWRLNPHYIQADDRVVCLAYTGTHVWAGSFDRSLYVIDKEDMTLAFERFTEHEDYVVDLQHDPVVENKIYSGSIDGTILIWNSIDITILQQIRITVKNMTSFKVIPEGIFWCCCQNNILKVTLDGQILASLYYQDETDRRVRLECFCIVEGEIWAGCSQVGRIVVWNMQTLDRKAVLPIDCRGVSRIIAVDDVVYIGCKAPLISHETDKAPRRKASTLPAKDLRLKGLSAFQSNSPNQSQAQKFKAMLYVASARSSRIIHELPSHDDSIQCMSSVGVQYIITGSSSPEGKLAIWKHSAAFSDSL